MYKFESKHFHPQHKFFRALAQELGVIFSFSRLSLQNSVCYSFFSFSFSWLLPLFKPDYFILIYCKRFLIHPQTFSLSKFKGHSVYHRHSKLFGLLLCSNQFSFLTFTVAVALTAKRKSWHFILVFKAFYSLVPKYASCFMLLPMFQLNDTLKPPIS